MIVTSDEYINEIELIINSILEDNTTFYEEILTMIKNHDF